MAKKKVEKEFDSDEVEDSTPLDSMAEEDGKFSIWYKDYKGSWVRHGVYDSRKEAMGHLKDLVGIAQGGEADIFPGEGKPSFA